MKEFIGTFNFQGESVTLQTKAKNPDHAYYRFIGALSKQFSLAKRALLYHFDGLKDNYIIREKEEKEN